MPPVEPAPTPTPAFVSTATAKEIHDSEPAAEPGAGSPSPVEPAPKKRGRSRGDRAAATPAVPMAKWWKNASSRTVTLPLDAIRAEDAIQCRSNGLNEETVAEYAELLEAGTTLPPVVVVDDGTRKRLVDGFHRLEATRRVGRATVEVQVYDGDQPHALVYDGTGSPLPVH